MADQGVPLPESVRRLQQEDTATGEAVARDVTRLMVTLDAMRRAQDLVPALAGAESVQDRLSVLVDAARRAGGADGCWAVHWDGAVEDGPVHIAAFAQSGSTFDGSVPAPEGISQTVVGEVARTGAPMFSEDASSDPRLASAKSVHAVELKSVACLPLGPRGALYLASDLPGRFEGAIRARLVALASLASGFFPGVEAKGPDDALPVPELDELIGETPPMRALKATIGAFAPMPWAALVLGETGTGKELVARAIHRLSPMKDGPFVALNCGAIPENLAESELFGHVKGAFTGADADRDGAVSRAAGGTLFLDEVGELPAQVQAGLLRLLQEGTFRRVGDDTEKKSTARIVAATLRDLEGEDRDGFREDLYHRLSTCVLTVPPLRERRADLPGLIAHLLERVTEALPNNPEFSVDPEVGEQLARRTWPGNVRELENVLRRAAALALASGSTHLEPAHLAGFRGEARPAAEELSPGPIELPVDLTAEVALFQERIVKQALEETDGNRTKAAELLGVSRQWLHRLVSRMDEA